MNKRIHLHSVSSTSSYLKSHAEDYGDFSFVSADFQTSGHGRLGRTWLSKAGENLMFSFIIKNPDILSLGPKVTLLVAYIVARSIEKMGVKDVYIKWPNDVYIGSKKVVGILLEGSLPHYLVVGVGINVNQTQFEGEYHNEPTSLALRLGHKIDLESYKNNLYDEIEAGFATFSINYHRALEFFAKHDYLCGRQVFLEGKGPYIAKGVDEDFCLLLLDEDAIIKNVSGEISLHL